MSTILADFVSRPITVTTSDGRLFHGTLLGFDQSTNMVLEGCEEKVISADNPTALQSIELGVCIIRGDSVVFLGDIELNQSNCLTLGSILRPLK